MIYTCSVCGFKYDESKEKVPFKDLPDTWACPVCGVGKKMFKPENSESPERQPEAAAEPAAQTEGAAMSELPKTPETVSDALVQTLSNWGVKWVFGMVGHSNLGAAEAIRKLAAKGEMRFVGIRHEGAAAFACSAYGKLTGKPAACITIAGPGATNLITGLYDAKLDRAPVIALTGQVPLSEKGRYAFQEIDLVKSFADVAGYQAEISDSCDAGETASRLCKNAMLSKSPSQAILPDDMQTRAIKPGRKAGFPGAFKTSAKSVPPISDVQAAADLLRTAKRPIIVVGEGCAESIGAVADFAEHFAIPFATTYRAKGFLPDSHQLACGVIGASGTQVSAKIAGECDFIIGLGTGFSRHSMIPDGKHIIQIDIRPEALGRLKKIDLGIVGDVGQTLPILKELLKNSAAFEDRCGQIAEEWKSWRAEKERRAARSRIGAIDAAAVCGALSRHVPPNAIVSVDVGNVAYSYGRYFESKNQRALLSFYLGSIGVGLPGAMGAWCAANEKGGVFEGRPVVAVVGDGGLGQYLAEWTTVAKYGMDIKLVVFNNSELAKISLEQRNAHMEVWETSLKNPPFSEFAKLCGTKSLRISDPETLDAQMASAMSERGAVLIEVDVAP